MTKRKNKLIDAETVVDGIFDRTLVLVPFRAIFHSVGRGKVKKVKISFYEDNAGEPNMYMGESEIFMS